MPDNANAVEVARARPAPTDEEMSAIAAAVTLLWPRPQVPTGPEPPPPWRFSGRWWTKPIAARRDRPGL